MDDGPFGFVDRSEKYHRSRAFGERHRAKALAEETRCIAELEELQREHTLLRSLRDRAFDLRAASPVPFSASQLSFEPIAPLPPQPFATLALSANSASLLGTHMLDGPTALALLELTVLRRNLGVIGIVRDRVPPPAAALDFLFRRAMVTWTSTGGSLYASMQLVKLDRLCSRWHDAEIARDIKTARDDSVRTVLYNRLYDQGELDPRRCTRCKKLKLAGSGHGRSSCDDGVYIALAIPYPAPPSLARSLAAARPSGGLRKR